MQASLVVSVSHHLFFFDHLWYDVNKSYGSIVCGSIIVKMHALVYFPTYVLKRGEYTFYGVKL